MAAPASSPMSAVFSYEQEAIRCPYPHYAQLRAGSPVYHDEQHDVYIVSKHADIEAVTSQPKLFSNQNPMGPTVTDTVTAMQRALASAPPEVAERAAVVMSRGNVLLTRDPPVHTQHRRILNRAFTPRSIARIEPFVRESCQSLVQSFAESVELISEYCTPAPIRALAALLGVSADRAGDFARWSHAINAAIGSSMTDEEILATLEVQGEFWSFCEDEIADRTRNPREDLISAVATATADDGTPLTLNEKVGLCTQLVTAGADTTTKHLSAFVLRLCREPELMARVRAGTEELPLYLEESLRLESPVQGLFRIATADTELGGTPIPAGAYVLVLFASANRDETVFERPESFEPARPRLRAHQAFGHGPHTCMGAPLARSVSKIAIEVLLAEFADIRLADPNFEPSYDPSYIMRGMQTLPVQVRRN